MATDESTGSLTKTGETLSSNTYLHSLDPMLLPRLISNGAERTLSLGEAAEWAAALAAYVKWARKVQSVANSSS